MKKTVILFLGLFLLLNSIKSQIVVMEPLSIRQTYYSIDARLDTAKRVITGSMETYWVNKSSDVVPEVQMHLYMNAFRSKRTTFNREGGLISDMKVADFGSIDIKSISDRSGRDLLSDLHFFSPDDGNLHDSTVAKLDLREPAHPGDTVFFTINFETKLPGRIIRTGYKDNFYFVGQWFPKFGVYESAGMRYAIVGRWNCHQFHLNSEFYSDHSVYDVKITLPVNYVVGSGGLLLDDKKEGREKTLTYRAEDIVDFAWTAWPSFVEFTDQWKHVKITLLMPAARVIQAKRQMTSVKHALDYFEKNVGPYPWPHLTFIDPPSIGDGSGGMEYTTIFTSESFKGVPEFLHFPEMVTIHEFGHAYFMGILASNEFEEPWLDEGVNQFWETRIMDNYYGNTTSMVDHPLLAISDQTIARSSYVNSDSRQVATNNEYSWNYPHGTYGMMTYHKTAVVLRTLMGLVGEETINEIFREYYRRWAFRHPSGRDFINVVNDVVKKDQGEKFGPDMNWFFDQTIYGTGICDYKVSDISNQRMHDLDNDSGSINIIPGFQSKNDSLYIAVVELERLGEVILPVEVLVHFKDGNEVHETWDGKSRFEDFRYERKGKVQWVKIDPDYKLVMDVNYINNSMTLEPDRIPVSRLSGKLTAILQFFISAISL